MPDTAAEALRRIHEAADFVSAHLGKADLAVVLGSGLGDFADELDLAKALPFEEIPGFARATVPGHEGTLFLGKLGGKTLLVQRGRFHYYEGYGADQVVFPVRMMQALGVKTLILTNAAGAVNEAFAPGELMLIEDFLNLSGVNPLRGPNLDGIGPRFPDMSEALDPGLRETALRVAWDLRQELRRGVYAQMQGPSFETPAEIRMLRALGADAVGMSTVPEILAARHGGIRVLGLSCLTNMAAGILPQPLSHQEVMEVGCAARGRFSALLKGLIGAV